MPRISSLAISILIYSLSVAVAEEPFHDAIVLERPGVKILYLSSDVAVALEIAKLEAQKQKITADQIAHLAVFFMRIRSWSPLALHMAADWMAQSFELKYDVRILR